MLERRAGEDLFRKHVATLVSAAAEGPPNAAPLDNDAAAAAAPGVEANTEIAATDSAGTRQAARNLDASSFLGELARCVLCHTWF